MFGTSIRPIAQDIRYAGSDTARPQTWSRPSIRWNCLCDESEPPPWDADFAKSIRQTLRAFKYQRW